MKRFDFSKTSSFRSSKVSPGFLLWHVSTLWRRSIEAVLKPLSLTHPQFVILATIGYLTVDGARATQVAIGRHAGLDPNTTSQILRGLQAKKLIKRKLLQDERSKYPELTAEGAALLSQALPAVERADCEFFKPVNLTEVDALQALQTLALF